MKKFFHHIHLWLAVPFGLIVTVTCFTGALLVFEDEITRSAHHDLYFVEQVGAKPLPLDVLTATVAEQLPEGSSVTGVTLYNDAERTCRVTLSQPRRAAVMVDPYTGAIKGQDVGRTSFYATVFRLHRWLLDSMSTGGRMSVGKLLVGISTLMFVIVLISGIVIWVPRTAKALRNSLKIPVRRGWHCLWHGLHAAGGMYAMVFLLALALTGLTWSFPWYRTGFYALFGIENGRQGSGQGGGQGMAAHGQGQGQGNGYGHGRAQEETAEPEGAVMAWQQACDAVMAAAPDWRQITLSEGKATVSHDRLGNRRASDSYAFDPATGALVGVTPYSVAGAGSRLGGWIYSVHTGSWGGAVTRVLTCLAALLGASLPLTGYYLWIRKMVVRRRNQKLVAAR